MVTNILPSLLSLVSLSKSLSAPAIVILVIYFVFFPVDISSSAQFKFSQELLNSLQKSHQDVPNTILTKNHTKTEPIFHFDTNSEFVYMVISRREDVKLRQTVRETWASNIRESRAWAPRWHPPGGVDGFTLVLP